MLPLFAVNSCAVHSEQFNPVSHKGEVGQIIVATLKLFISEAQESISCRCQHEREKLLIRCGNNCDLTNAKEEVKIHAVAKKFSGFNSFRQKSEKCMFG